MHPCWNTCTILYMLENNFAKNFDLDIIVARLGEEGVNLSFVPRTMAMSALILIPCIVMLSLDRRVRILSDVENKIEERLVNIAQVDNICCVYLCQRKRVTSYHLLWVEGIHLDVVQGRYIHIFDSMGRVATDLCDCTSQVVHVCPIFYPWEFKDLSKYHQPWLGNWNTRCEGCYW